MKLNIKSVGVDIGPRLEERIKKKMAKFDRYFDDNSFCEVKATLDGPHLKRIEITLHVDRHIYRAERSEQDFFTALDMAQSALEGQIRKHKTLMNRQHKHDHLDKYLAEEAFDLDDVGANLQPEHTYRYKRFEIHPMSREEAALQMELIDHDFFLYLNDETNMVNLIYKRKENDYGIIEPDYIS